VERFAGSNVVTGVNALERFARSGVGHSAAGNPARLRRWRRSAGRTSATLAVMAATLLAAGADVRALAPTSVEIQDSKYLPSTLTIPAGTTVKWTNKDEETHTVTSNTPGFGSAGLELGDEYTHTFTTPGVYPYGCDLHSFMQGTIVVN